MKVLQINSVYGIGSTGRIAQDLNNLLIEKGHQSYVAYGRESITEDDNIIRIGSRFDNYFHVAVTRLLDRHGFASKKSTIEFIEKIDEINPDIVHFHNLHGYYINVKILFDYLKENNKKVVWTLHDCWSFTGHCSYFDYVGCENWKTKCQNCPQKKEYPASYFIDNSKKNYIDKKIIFNKLDDNNLIIVTPSDWLADLVKKSFLKNYKIKVINNGIDLYKFRPLKSNFKDKHNMKNKLMILGVASKWTRRKGLKYFIDLANKLDDNKIIVLVGLSKNQKNKLPKNIIGIERTNDVKELIEIYSAADVFLNPTLEDNFPTTNLEALACGTPVITFNTGGSVESVNNNVGRIVEKGDIDSVIKIINKLYTGELSFDPEICVKFAKDNFDKYERYNDYLNLYNSLNK
ncbi:glycosyltransferase [Halanaerobium congolense]|uniref:glycosyltransferase n=1 Tax=Halanaerobium congolense TaxID=54121 RepID=UPI00087FDC69|nr:glycosyltransferase [Halanaerobium congolense]SDK97282.1 Glycosyltransferase involved in cell wall bisynthesis [Halanaerobium congolense]SDM95662.1 Glycosyltransferase involved in cell wall bisynthesis [Halanaerobium congolense]